MFFVFNLLRTKSDKLCSRYLWLISL